ncbi:MAG: glycosyltransferase family 2 protein [Methylobacter sp.]|nr:glycosyltransferase family 2 protein [Methylobacter sp.]
MNDDVWVVIAAFNEGEVIGQVISRLRKSFDNIAVVDDDSKDQTASNSIEAGAWVITHPINLGQGAALQTGIDFAIERGAAYIVTFDGDGQHRPEDALSMVERAQAGNVDVVLGSRFLGNAVGIPKFRRLILKLAAAFTALTSGIWLTDAHNGLRVLTADAAKKIRLQQNRMAHASELIDLAAWLKLRVVEHPVTIEYTPYSLAKGQKLSNSISILTDLLIAKIAK